jgi:chromosome condensin MukBEF ATPase and DNA-binding subunit MukB
MTQSGNVGGVSHDVAETEVGADARVPGWQGGSTVPVPGRNGGELERQMDALSLHQALLDFELANARVLDLTARLVEANTRVMRHQSETDALRAEITSFQACVDTAQSEAATSAQAAEAAKSEAAAARLEALSALAERDAAKTQTGEVAAELAATHNSRTFRIARKLKSFSRISSIAHFARRS